MHILIHSSFVIPDKSPHLETPVADISILQQDPFSAIVEDEWPSPKIGAITNPIKQVNLIKIFIEGPEVSLNGSPTVSPVTAALCASEPL
ncbi:hypothetical protein D3C72_1817920 [compost metagenome]